MPNNDKKSGNFKGNDQLKKLIIYYVYAKKANWVLVDKAINDIEQVDEDAAGDMFETIVPDDFMIINELDYPANFRDCAMPPLCIFTWGNRALLDNHNKIISLWGDVNIDDMIKYALPADQIYAVIVNSDNQENIKKILKKGYKLILVANTNYDFVKINEITSKNNDTLFITEVPPDILIPDLDLDQTNERLLYGIGKDQILLPVDTNIFNNLTSFIDVFEKKVYAVDINRYTAQEVTQFNLMQYKKRTN